MQLQSQSEFGALWQSLLNEPKLRSAAEAEAKQRLVEFLQGVVRYQDSRFHRDNGEFPCVLQKGSTRLLDCGGTADAPRVLLVPSLINRYYILDLTKELSLARYLGAQGFRVYMVDWGSPSDAEAVYNCAAYVSERLALMTEWIKQDNSRSRLTVAGYCMGGLLTLALACARPDLVDALACFATPWDFSVPDFPRIALPQEDVQRIEHYIASEDTVPAETIHTLFHLANPYGFQNKLREFRLMEEGSQEMRDFLAIEHWVQDGVPMTRGVAQDCLVEWAQRNNTAKLLWRACGRVVNPEQLMMPVFIAAPKGDRIVPSSCALPLAKLCRNVTLIEPSSGHVSMVVGGKRKKALWEPFSVWLKTQAA